MTALNFDDCIGCGLCVLGCPAFEETGFDLLTARGRNKALQSGLAAGDMVEPMWACTLCGYCDAICPTHVHNVEIVLHLRRELAGTVRLKPDTTENAAEVRLKSDATNTSPSDATNSSLSDATNTSPSDATNSSRSYVASDFSRTMTTTPPSLVLGCTIRERAPHL